MKNLKVTPEIQKEIDKISYYDLERFTQDAKRYIKAIKDNRMICSIKSVSASGMSRTILFTSCEKAKNPARPYYQSNYFCLFKALGYSESRTKEGFLIYGCGMDMIFHTNYTIIHRLCRLGLINKKECEKLAQATPVVI